jgi:tRNA(fMet)-specific endonuclease VapC
MTARFLLDTNVISEPLRPKPNVGVMARLKQHERELVLAAPVWHELCHGCERLPDGKRRNAIRRYLQEVVAPSIAILPYDTSAAKWHADERARLEAIGMKTAFVDGQIAAIAKVNDLILVTANRSDFAPFAGLRLEDWMR